MLSEQDLEKELKKVKLRYVTDKRPGIMRQKVGAEFKYYNSEGRVVRNKKTLNRINKLAIPPAWENVWICPNPRGHLQAIGYDDKGRKQYSYHYLWTKMCQDNKFSKMVDFAKVLPKIRAQVKKDMVLPGLPRKKVVATVVWLLEHTFIRVGNDEYARENDSFGLTTLRNRHVDIKGDNIRLEFLGKSAVRHIVDIKHPMVSKIIRKCIELPGYELFQYLDEKGRRHVIDSADVNNYLKEITGEEITAKDFRTWGATLLSALTLQKMGVCANDKIFKQNIKEALKQVSAHLRNTPKVCRNYYIHPTIIQSYQKKILNDHFNKTRIKAYNGLTRNERIIITLLKRYPSI